ncbi:MAG TPA: methyl-accepting chemotaxis protein, partial [Burkholderiales bacterium]|nr:methyl-accepting chemotaxis protein [Burkholderiales bacterium]
KQVDSAGRTMEEIVASVKRVADIMAEITAASMEQSSGIEQVNEAITQMDQVTQQNAALVEEAAAAAESMKMQAKGLSEAVRVFKLSDIKRQVARSESLSVTMPKTLENRAKRLALPAKAARDKLAFAGQGK